MTIKDIKTQIRKQLKKEFPKWKRLSMKEKKAISKKVLEEVISSYDFDKEIETSLDELLGIEGQHPAAGIMNIEEMKNFIKNHNNSKMFNIEKFQHPAIKDKELKIIDQILDNDIINRLLSYDSYSPAMRQFYPSTFFRAELLKAIKFPEISYRKFCGDDNSYSGHKINNKYTGTSQKENRAFIGLPLNKNLMLTHAQLSQFRSSLTFNQLVNLMVYILAHFQDKGFLGGDNIHCVDSTELAIDCQKLLAKLDINGQKIRIYDDIDSDCGKRRNKRDKSVYVVGYRLHTLTAINSKTGQSYPLISLVAPANHHDSHFLAPLISLGQSIGLDIKLVTVDEAYNDKSGAIYEKTGVNIIRPANGKVKNPKNVDIETMTVNFDGLCDIPMEYVGVENNIHEFKCNVGVDECPRAGTCPRYRNISVDTGHFQRILHNRNEVTKALNIRKNGERPFNLLKKREGLDQIRVRSQHGVIAKGMFTTIATLLIEMAGTRKKIKKKQMQLKLPMAA